MDPRVDVNTVPPFEPVHASLRRFSVLLGSISNGSSSFKLILKLLLENFPEILQNCTTFKDSVFEAFNRIVDLLFSKASENTTKHEAVSIAKAIRAIRDEDGTFDVLELQLPAILKTISYITHQNPIDGDTALKIINALTSLLARLGMSSDLLNQNNKPIDLEEFNQLNLRRNAIGTILVETFAFQQFYPKLVAFTQRALWKTHAGNNIVESMIDVLIDPQSCGRVNQIINNFLTSLPPAVAFYKDFVQSTVVAIGAIDSFWTGRQERRLIREVNARNNPQNFNNNPKPYDAYTTPITNLFEGNALQPQSELARGMNLGRASQVEFDNGADARSYMEILQQDLPKVWGFFGGNSNANTVQVAVFVGYRALFEKWRNVRNRVSLIQINTWLSTLLNSIFNGPFVNQFLTYFSRARRDPLTLTNIISGVCPTPQNGVFPGMAPFQNWQQQQNVPYWQQQQNVPYWPQQQNVPSYWQQQSVLPLIQPQDFSLVAWYLSLQLFDKELSYLQFSYDNLMQLYRPYINVIPVDMWGEVWNKLMTEHYEALIRISMVPGFEIARYHLFDSLVNRNK